MINIISNGSHWYGESPDSIEQLLEVLRSETLDPTFEEYGNFIIADSGSPVRFFGNFFTVSHVFNVDTDEVEIIAMLTSAIRENQGTPRYVEAKRQRYAHKEREKAEREATRQARREQEIAHAKAVLQSVESGS